MLVLPFPTVLYQLFLLWVVVEVERPMLLNRLTLPPHDAGYYAGILNLVSTLVGWLAFFATQPLLSLVGLERPVAELILTGQGLLYIENSQIGVGNPDLLSWLIVSALLAYFGTVFIEKWTLQGLDWFFNRHQFKGADNARLREHFLVINGRSFLVMVALRVLAYLLLRPLGIL
ncbi:hypothetical protein [Leptolyngbya sp. FACHB-261]|uniref:hypothetical protein n=1 Tax=Leptolyngbya sp. FACHB-261 TaxID=2692806 RepID=UPI001687C343|nr:hypothetical protein [Leptolyngbya sp. FACHB-261]MBD2104339.1 hypothetical protein [Leptolyngbya sp. FACHB-261]